MPDTAYSPGHRMNRQHSATERILAESTRRVVRDKPIQLPAVRSYDYICRAMHSGIARPSDQKVIFLEYARYRHHAITSLEAWARFICGLNGATSHKQRSRIERILAEKPFPIADEYWRARCAETFGGIVFRREVMRDWCNRGLLSRRNGPRVYLDHFMVGNQVYTSIPAVVRFYEKLQRDRFSM